MGRRISSSLQQQQYGSMMTIDKYCRHDVWDEEGGRSDCEKSDGVHDLSCPFSRDSMSLHCKNMEQDGTSFWLRMTRWRKEGKLWDGK
mmetsp:Transcript_40819/g.66989  ORF Transcript_40819/g.66989 Transcript_40819/m.66989 type:complete len:88 (-) Transcript_40819:193-456(-)